MEKLKINGLGCVKLLAPGDFPAKTILGIRRICAVAGVALVASVSMPCAAHAQMDMSGNGLGLGGIGQSMGFDSENSSQAGQDFATARAMMRVEAAKIAENAVVTTLIQIYGNMQTTNYAAGRVEHISLLAAGKVDEMVDQQPFLIVNPGQTIIDGIRAVMPTVAQSDLAALGLPTDPQSVDNFVQQASAVALDITRNEGQLQMQRPDVFNEQVAATIANNRGRGFFGQREQEPISALQNDGGMNPY